MAQYGKADYWEARYTKDPDPFDWYQSYASSPAMRDLIRRSVPSSGTILVPGCGSSRLSEDMLTDGYVNGIVSVDQSLTVINALEDRLKGQPSLQFRVMNVWKKLEFPDRQFDAVVDKALLDSLLCGERSTANAGLYVKEVARCLKPGGVFIVVSFGAPENRLSYFEGDYGWTTTVTAIPKPSINAAGLAEAATEPGQNHYVYVSKKAAE